MSPGLIVRGREAQSAGKRSESDPPAPEENRGANEDFYKKERPLKRLTNGGTQREGRPVKRNLSAGNLTARRTATKAWKGGREGEEDIHSLRECDRIGMSSLHATKRKVFLQPSRKKKVLCAKKGTPQAR